MIKEGDSRMSWGLTSKIKDENTCQFLCGNPFSRKWSSLPPLITGTS